MIKGYYKNVASALRGWEQRTLKLNVFEACTATDFLINLRYDSNGHVTREAAHRWQNEHMWILLQVRVVSKEKARALIFGRDYSGIIMV